MTAQTPPAATATEAIRVAAVFVDPANAVHTDLLARPNAGHACVVYGADVPAGHVGVEMTTTPGSFCCRAA